MYTVPSKSIEAWKSSSLWGVSRKTQFIVGHVPAKILGYVLNRLFFNFSSHAPYCTSPVILLYKGSFRTRTQKQNSQNNVQTVVFANKYFSCCAVQHAAGYTAVHQSAILCRRFFSTQDAHVLMLLFTCCAAGRSVLVDAHVDTQQFQAICKRP